MPRDNERELIKLISARALNGLFICPVTGQVWAKKKKKKEQHMESF